MSGRCVNALVYGCRAWAEHGLHQHGHKMVNVPAKTGGTVAAYAGELYAVNWDTGQQSVHYYNELHMRLCVIGSARTLAEFEDGIMAGAVSVRKVLGPQGGVREFTVSLNNGDWASGLSYLEPRLLAANIPVHTEQLARKQRTR